MPAIPPSELTRIINGLPNGVASKADLDRLIEVVYTELQALAGSRMRHERPDHTLQPTALVHEAFLRLVKTDELQVEGRCHFFGILARTMRQVLVQHARARNAEKRGGDLKRVDITLSGLPDGEQGVDILDLDRVLVELEQLDERAASVVEMKFFAGLDMQGIADVLGVSRRTVQTDWSMARVWLRRELGTDPTA